VVNDITLLDQEYINKLSRMLKSSTSNIDNNKKLIIIHNFKNTMTKVEAGEKWNKYVKIIYDKNDCEEKSMEIRKQPVVWLENKEGVRHVCIFNNACKEGKIHNPLIFELLNQWVGAFSGVKNEYKLLQKIESIIKEILKKYISNVEKVEYNISTGTIVAISEKDKEVELKAIRQDLLTGETLFSENITLSIPTTIYECFDDGEDYLTVIIDIPGKIGLKLESSDSGITFKITKTNEDEIKDYPTKFMHEAPGHPKRQFTKGEEKFIFRLPSHLSSKYNISAFDKDILQMSNGQIIFFLPMVTQPKEEIIASVTTPTKINKPNFKKK